MSSRTVITIAFSFCLIVILVGLAILALNATPNGSISGMVLIGPVCPVLRDPPDENCADKPYAANLVITPHDQPKRVIRGFKSDADGKFTIWVRPGQYTIRSAAAANVLPYCGNDEIINVSANEDTKVTVNCDSGIR